MKDIREIETEVDEFYLSSSFLKKPLQQAVFDLLRFYENANQLSSFVDSLKGGALGFDGIKRDLMDALNMALHWIFKQNKNIGQFSFDYEEADYGQAMIFLYNYALPYSKVCDAYIAYSRGRFKASVGGEGGKDVYFKVSGVQGLTFEEEMSEFFEKSSSLNEYANKIGEVIDKNNHLILDLISTIHFEDGRLCYEIKRKAAEVYKKVADIHWNETSTLPKDWIFNDFSLEDYRKCWRELFSLSYIHATVCMHCKDGLAYKDCVIVQKREDLISYICGNIGEEVCDDSSSELRRRVSSIVDLMIFNHNLKHGDIMYQPLVAVDDWLFIAPSLFINGVPERNLIALIQQLNRDKKHFDEVNKLEGLMRDQIEKRISKREDDVITCQDVEIKENGKTTTDVDFGLYDKPTNSVLLCEMKWLISADATTEVYAREDDVDHGCEQAGEAMAYAMMNPQEFMKKAFNVVVSDSIEFFCCVITKADVRSNNRLVPVISQRKFEELIENKQRYRDIFESIRNRDFYKPLHDELKFDDHAFEYAGYTFHVPAMMIPDEINRVKI